MQAKHALLEAHTLYPELALSEIKSLLCLALSKDRAWLIAHSDDELPTLGAFNELLQRRQQGEPMAYLRGAQEFYGRDFVVSPAVLIPRPETEHLIDIALGLLTPNTRVLDLCTGSGIVPITLAKEYPQAHYFASDISASALHIASLNAQTLGATVTFSCQDLLAQTTGKYGLITCNPPYLSGYDPHLGALHFEPRLALSDEADGLSFYRRLAQEAYAFLHPHGHLLIEHGHDQAEAVRHIFNTSHWAPSQAYVDLAGHRRGMLIKRA
ncbi:MAG: hypothetical protein RLZZ502_1875 [Pseudomonadota bacterium]|jgi:release factor glutamine methyltransferase